MSSSAGSAVGAPSSYTEFGPPLRMMPVGFHSRIHSTRARRRMDLGVDARLAHAARDELRELRAVVDDQDA